MNRDGDDSGLLPDPTLDLFRDTIAELTAGSVVVGYLSTKVNIWRPRRGLWVRRWRDHRAPLEETVEWYLQGPICDEDDGWDDGWGLSEEDLADLREGRFEYGEECYSVRWLGDEEAAAAMSTLGSDKPT